MTFYVTGEAGAGVKMALELLEAHQSVNGMCAQCGTKFPCQAPGVVAANKLLDLPEPVIRASMQPDGAVGVCAATDAGTGDQVGGRRANGDVAAPFPRHTDIISPSAVGWPLTNNPHRLQAIKIHGRYER